MAGEEREHLCHRHTGTEHLLLGILRSASVAATLLEKRGLTVDRVHQVIRQQSLIVESGEVSRAKATSWSWLTNSGLYTHNPVKSASARAV